jgi:nicotinate dehydrogenase subunit A
MAHLTLQVNGKSLSFQADDDIPLLYALRDELNFHGPKFGCGLGQCGACTVLVNNQATRSCVTPASAVAWPKNHDSRRSW